VLVAVEAEWHAVFAKPFLLTFTAFLYFKGTMMV
jgi:hypothetical protein